MRMSKPINLKTFNKRVKFLMMTSGKSYGDAVETAYHEWKVKNGELTNSEKCKLAGVRYTCNGRQFFS